MDEPASPEGWLPDDLYSLFVEKLPQAAVELVVQTEFGILLTKRAIEPAKGEWFWPGSLPRKGETFEEAAHRIAETELGIDIHIKRQIGPYEHFWETSNAKGSPSRHTINIVFIVEPAGELDEIELDDQHSDYKFITELEEDLHEYVKRYLTDNNLLSYPD